MPESATTWFALIAILAWAMAGTARQDAPRTDATASTSVVTITASDFHLEAPDTIDPGFTRFRLINRGSLIHMAHIVRVDSGKSVQEFLDAYAKAIRTAGPRPAWIAGQTKKQLVETRGT